MQSGYNYRTWHEKIYQADMGEKGNEIEQPN